MVAVAWFFLVGLRTYQHPLVLRILPLCISVLPRNLTFSNTINQLVFNLDKNCVLCEVFYIIYKNVIPKSESIYNTIPRNVLRNYTGMDHTVTLNINLIVTTFPIVLIRSDFLCFCSKNSDALLS